MLATNCCRPDTESKFSVDSALNTNWVNAVLAAALSPSSRLTSIRVASPDELSVGSGRSTASPRLAGGPPAAGGSSTLQVGGESKTCVLAATAAVVTSSSGERATLLPVGCTTWAPTGYVRATSTHRVESGIQASTGAAPPSEAWPSIWLASVAESPSVTWTSMHRPAAVTFWLLKERAMSSMAGAMS